VTEKLGVAATFSVRKSKPLEDVKVLSTIEVVLLQFHRDCIGDGLVDPLMRQPHD
jgi:hypothetical protein